MLSGKLGGYMHKSKWYAVGGAIITLTAIFAIVHGDLVLAAPLFLIGAFICLRAHGEWKRENA